MSKRRLAGPLFAVRPMIVALGYCVLPLGLAGPVFGQVFIQGADVGPSRTESGMDYSNSATTIIRAASGGSYTGTNITGSTTANGAYGAYAQNGGQITLNGGTFLLNATATNAHGLFASGAGSQINANGVTITTTAGNSSAAISNAAGGGIALGTGSILSSDAGTTLQVSAGAVSGNNLSLTSNRLGAALTPQLIALPSYPGGWRAPTPSIRTIAETMPRWRRI